MQYLDMFFISGAATDTNAYNFWIENNENFTSVVLKAVDLIDNFGNVVNWEKALAIMQLTLGYEADIFASATD